MGTKPRLRWKKDPKETGLSAVTRDPAQRPSELHDGTRSYATVYSHGYHALSRSDGWYWVANDQDAGVPYHNTCGLPVATEAEAKAAALEYVRTCLAKATQQPTPRQCRGHQISGDWSEWVCPLRKLSKPGAHRPLF